MCQFIDLPLAFRVPTRQAMRHFENRPFRNAGRVPVRTAPATLTASTPGVPKLVDASASDSAAVAELTSLLLPPRTFRRTR